jgi:hypothetical protein
VENRFPSRPIRTNLPTLLPTRFLYLIENTSHRFGNPLALLYLEVGGFSVIVFALVAALVVLVAVSFTSSMFSSPRRRS